MEQKYTEKIAGRQFLFMLFLMRATVVVATLPVVSTGHALQDAWAAALVTGAVSAVFVVIVAGLSTRFPGLSLVEYCRRLLGKYLALPFIILFMWWYLWIAAVDVRIYAEILHIAFLPDTPVTMIIAPMIFISVLTIYFGVEVIGRLADLVLPIFITFIVATLVVTLYIADPTNLEPVLARGLKPVLTSVFTPITIVAQFISIGMLAPALLRPQEVTRLALIALGLNVLLLVCTSAIVIMALGPQIVTESTFPFFKMARDLELTPFLQRLEAFMVLAWGLGLGVDLAIFVYCGAMGVSQLFGLDDYRLLLLPMGVIWVVHSIQSFPDEFALFGFFSPETIFPYFVLCLVVPLFVLWLVFLLRLFLAIDSPGSAKRGRR